MSEARRALRFAGLNGHGAQREALHRASRRAPAVEWLKGTCFQSTAFGQAR